MLLPKHGTRGARGWESARARAAHGRARSATRLRRPWRREPPRPRGACSDRTKRGPRTLHAAVRQITVALSVFRDDAGYAAGIPLIYGAIEPLVIAPFCLLAWKAGWTYGDSRLPFSQWLLNNYQPVAETNHPAYTRNVSSGEDDAAGARAAAWQAPGSRRKSDVKGQGRTAHDGRTRTDASLGLML